ncbi:MAG: hypothetical protein HUJ58_08435 [Erysipelotrichaceae bacterium]|nr:hypothetical protein [Erysipelotrichaceae bacterium]
MEPLITELNRILPVVTRVHSDHHPELREVLTQYEKLTEAVNANDNNAVKERIEKIAEITNQFTIPEDACPTYTKAYQALHNIYTLCK